MSLQHQLRLRWRTSLHTRIICHSTHWAKRATWDGKIEVLRKYDQPWELKSSPTQRQSMVQVVQLWAVLLVQFWEAVGSASLLVPSWGQSSSWIICFFFCFAFLILIYIAFALFAFDIFIFYCFIPTERSVTLYLASNNFLCLLFCCCCFSLFIFCVNFVISDCWGFLVHQDCYRGYLNHNCCFWRCRCSVSEFRVGLLYSSIRKQGAKKRAKENKKWWQISKK